ncbi:septum-promoting GTP-binding protein 1-like [Cornus florida]|uniref:septum-promoting GTP-binding protein 1-like n=1 Tax=Cornus florida TaxID=4283 RepID=UPI00289703DE|nr:septum-promoting GTP-binding protein 1-like [Cornus florida]
MATRALEAIRSMTQLCRIPLRFKLRRRILRRVSILRRHLLMLWSQVLSCVIGKSVHYRPLPRATISSSSSSPSPGAVKCGFAPEDSPSPNCDHHKDSSDLVALKISLLGDCQIGKTSFLTKYVGKEKEQEDLQNTGLNQMDKTLCVKGAHITYNIWEVEGDENTQNNVPIACKDSVAMLFMFDLTSRCTLNSVINWYQEARKWNQTAIPILIGTKFDDFVQLPIDLQWTIASQARAYAKALNATLFFSSATYNINVNKIFKFITAKLFNLPWTLERNLTIGEPIIDF